MKLKLACLAAGTVLLTGYVLHAQQQQPAAPPPASNDPYVWLADVTGDKAMAWVRARNAESARELETGESFKTLQADILKILDSDARIPSAGSMPTGCSRRTWMVPTRRVPACATTSATCGWWRRTPPPTPAQRPLMAQLTGEPHNALHDAMRQGGVRLHQHPEIVVRHRMHYTVGLYLGQRFLFSRAWAGMKAAGVLGLERLARGAAAALLPPVLFLRVARTVWGKKAHRAELARSLPLIGLFTLAWGVGEMAGYWFGPGDALARVR